MNPYTALAVMALAAAVYAEAPYSYNRPSVGTSISGISGGGNYEPIPAGQQTSEGYSVDQVLLDKVRDIIFREEMNRQSTGGGGGGGSGGGYPSSTYGVPSTVYGVPRYATRIIGIVFEGLKQSKEIAAYRQTTTGYVGGYPMVTYGVPSGPYGVPH